MSGMEPDVQDFLKRIIQTVSMSLLFLLLHMTFAFISTGLFLRVPPLLAILFTISFLLAHLPHYFIISTVCGKIMYSSWLTGVIRYNDPFSIDLFPE